jgi:tripartite-type tricarboxylate transporter receptor subunit TctC
MAVSSFSASAADFPNRPVDLVVGYKAGGGVDTYARALAKVASRHLDGQPIVVVNQPGGGGMIAGRFVADQPATGYSLYLASSGSFTLRNLAKKQVVSADDFKMVATIGDLTAGVFVPASSPIKSLEELIAALKKGDKKLRWGHTSRGNVWHIAGVGLLDANGVKARDIPFKGGAGVRSALVAEQIDFGVMGAHLGRGFEDEVRLLAVLSDQKHPAVPDAKTAKELGVEFTKVSSPIVVMAPSNVDDQVVDALSASILNMTADKEYVSVMENAGLPVIGLDAKATTEMLDGARGDWKSLVEAK